jgi:hypothetical protein
MNTSKRAALMLTHPAIDLTAGIEYWRALAQETLALRVQNARGPQGEILPDEWEIYVDATHDRDSRITGLLLRGIQEGGRGQRAIVWALGELERRREENQRLRVQEDEAKAVAALAEALKGEADQAVLDRLLPMLTERTQRAVRTQLGHQQ